MPPSTANKKLAVNLSTPRRPKGHVMPKQPEIDINYPGRLRSAHVLAVCAISHSSLYRRIKDGTFPKPDGVDGNRNFWSTSTILSFLHQPGETKNVN